MMEFTFEATPWEQALDARKPGDEISALKLLSLLEEEDGTLQLLLEDLQAPQPYEELVRRELKATLDSLLSTLGERQQQVLRLHYGMEDGICYSLDQIGKKLGISKERARQIEHQAMDKLQKLGASLGLEDFL